MAPLMMPKAQLLCTPVPNQISILSEVEKNSLIALPGKGGHSWLLPLKTLYPNPGGFDKEFCNNWSFLGGSDGKESARGAGDPGSVPGSGRSPGEGNGNPFQDSCLENSMDRGARWATVHGVTRSEHIQT